MLAQLHDAEEHVLDVGTGGVEEDEEEDRSRTAVFIPGPKSGAATANERASDGRIRGVNSK